MWIGELDVDLRLLGSLDVEAVATPDEVLLVHALVDQVDETLGRAVSPVARVVGRVSQAPVVIGFALRAALGRAPLIVVRTVASNGALGCVS